MSKEIAAKLARLSEHAALDKQLVDGVQDLIRGLAKDYAFDPLKLSDSDHARLSKEAFDLIDNWEAAIDAAGGMLEAKTPIQRQLAQLVVLSNQVLDLEMAIIGVMPSTH